MPLNDSAASSAAAARSRRLSASGIVSSSISRSGMDLANSALVASRTKGSSGASLAIATARSARLVMFSSSSWLVDIDAVRWPTKTRKPISKSSDLSLASTLPSRKLILVLCPLASIASAPSAPATLAASNNWAMSVS